MGVLGLLPRHVEHWGFFLGEVAAEVVCFDECLDLLGGVFVGRGRDVEAELGECGEAVADFVCGAEGAVGFFADWERWCEVEAGAVAALCVLGTDLGEVGHWGVRGKGQWQKF